MNGSVASENAYSTSSKCSSKSGMTTSGKKWPSQRPRAHKDLVYLCEEGRYRSVHVLAKLRNWHENDKNVHQNPTLDTISELAVVNETHGFVTYLLPKSSYTNTVAMSRLQCFHRNLRTVPMTMITPTCNAAQTALSVLLQVVLVSLQQSCRHRETYST